MCDPTAVSAALLRWYDLNARVLPWRTGPAERALGIWPDPYRVWLSEIMLQQTTVAAVRAYFLRFTELWPTVTALAAAPEAEVMAQWAGLGYYARARNLIACARAVADAGGQFPSERVALQALPGIGPYTAAAIAAIAFDRPETVVDGNVERVVARLFAEETPLPHAKPALTRLAASLTPRLRPGDYAQAVMDLGATICTHRNPACAQCPLAGFCAAHAQGIAAELPRKLAKPAKPLRRGIAYVCLRQDGAALLETRPPRGLLGGMTGWPGTEWTETTPQPAPPLVGDWAACEGVVRHTFTHFHLELEVRVRIAVPDDTPLRGGFTSFDPASLPTVMRKCWDLAEPSLDAARLLR
jgi:A/G-specific adenine glycosylase